MCDCTETTLCVPCQAAEAWDGEDEYVYVSPYCMHCGQHEEHHDDEYCNSIRDDVW